MRSPEISELPSPPAGRDDWPWTEASPRLPETLLEGSAWPRISIITPSFNREAFIEESLRSVLLQGYPNLELIVIDGGSHDATPEILERYDPWIAHWESKPDRGWRDAVNKGFARSTGDIVTFFSSDDLYFPGTFGLVGGRWPDLSGDDTKNYGAIVGGFFHLDGRSQVLEKAFNPARLPSPGPLDLSLIDPKHWRLHQVATFYLSEALDDIGRTLEDHLVYNADRELIYRLCRRFAVDLIDHPLSAFRVHGDSLAGGASRRSAAELEYAQMQLSFCNGDANETVRKKIARHFFAKSQMSFAKYNAHGATAMIALLKALRYQPSRLWTRGYLRLWLETLLGKQGTPEQRQGAAT